MHEFAFGVLGLLPKDFYLMTESEYISKCNGFWKREKIQWQHTRLLAYTIHTHTEGASDISIDEFMPLDGEETKRLTEEDIDQIFAEHTQFLG